MAADEEEGRPFEVLVGMLDREGEPNLLAPQADARARGGSTVCPVC